MRRRDRAARRVRRTVRWVVALAVAALLALVGYGWVRQHPQDNPWAPLDLSQPVGMFTGRKLAALGSDFPGCRALLDRAGVKYTVLPERSEGERCGYADGLRFTADDPRITPFSPANLGTACPVSAALALWQWEVVQPAAERHFRMRVSHIEHLGSYNCRRLYGRSSGDFSQHATADAVDISGFRLADGTRVTLVADWTKAGPRAAFLRDVRDGACGVFATVLSPDYNAAHRDHLHLDQADRGAMSWRACR
ncbi:extensin-like domain-containing protein [Sphingomonas radiodurans]|uniref:extensin-like domain-containing protein n=1 Tax=Sphingomonas radiodurans TaxID=2890321 RepID=UPI001E4CC320|nr:extensin family protein [Sphingomonas radiodurans]WBH17314.1 extensin family protein [Sphingomonas radiodurans]